MGRQGEAHASSRRSPAEFAIYLRMPGWCREAQARGQRQAGRQARRRARATPRSTATWKPGDVIELDLPMPIQRIEAHPRVKADAGRVAIQRGPIVYCFEAVDNGGPVQQHRPAARIRSSPPSIARTCWAA